MRIGRRARGVPDVEHDHRFVRDRVEDQVGIAQNRKHADVFALGDGAAASGDVGDDRDGLADGELHCARPLGLRAIRKSAMCVKSWTARGV